MFKRIMKGGQKKPSKPDPSDPSPYGPPAAAATVAVPPPSGTIEPLPLFRDVAVSERQSLFLRKLQICCHVLDFSDTLKSVREKEIKRQALMELVDFIQSGSGKITETCQEEMIKMVSANIFRCLPPASHENTGQDYRRSGGGGAVPRAGVAALAARLRASPQIRGFLRH
ncbi:Serine/threonine protein phosphatase 2A 57 kDa regulatory subunit B' alpha isoform [Spatholobus suberectus]|nr:Serine/threonine protein phosphatase 2A 57 kDa regulatory subunit B' alpha isoform [Spatholobus suberectus]